MKPKQLNDPAYLSQLNAKVKTRNWTAAEVRRSTRAECLQWHGDQFAKELANQTYPTIKTITKKEK